MGRIQALALIGRGGQGCGVCFSAGPLEVLVLTDRAGTFYQLPFVDVAPGESEAKTLESHLRAAYDLEATAGDPVAAADTGSVEQRVYQTQVADLLDLPDVLEHNQDRSMRLVWRNLAQLKEKWHAPGSLLQQIEQLLTGEG